MRPRARTDFDDSSIRPRHGVRDTAMWGDPRCEMDGTDRQSLPLVTEDGPTPRRSCVLNRRPRVLGHFSSVLTCRDAGSRRSVVVGNSTSSRVRRWAERGIFSWRALHGEQAFCYGDRTSSVLPATRAPDGSLQDACVKTLVRGVVRCTFPFVLPARQVRRVRCGGLCTSSFLPNWAPSQRANYAHASAH